MKTKFYLDCRRTKRGDVAPIRLLISHRNSNTMISMNVSVLPSQWNAKTERVENHPRKTALNSYLQRRKLDIEQQILAIPATSLRVMTATEIRSRIDLVDKLENEDKSFVAVFNKFIETKTNKATKRLYQLTLSRLQAYNDKLDALQFEDITIDFLKRFDNFLAKTSPKKNARNIHLRNIRAVFNYAIDNEVTKAYPFRRLKIRPAQTAKRSLTVEQLRRIFNMDVDEHQELYRDMFKLIFYLCGINIVDLLNLKAISADGRIEYDRAKTSRHYSIKVEPEALALFEKYKGEKYLLSILDRYSDYRDFRARMNINLRRLGHVDVLAHGKKVFHPEFPFLSTYWARHTWATIAASLDIPKDTIAAALGHGRTTVTDIYINFDERKIDEANRKVIDFVDKFRPMHLGN